MNHIRILKIDVRLILRSQTQTVEKEEKAGFILTGNKVFSLDDSADQEVYFSILETLFPHVALGFEDSFEKKKKTFNNMSLLFSPSIWRKFFEISILCALCINT